MGKVLTHVVKVFMFFFFAVDVVVESFDMMAKGL